MRDVTERIFKGAISVFAEVTLYRRFSTKENLFITVIKNVLEKKFHSHVLEMAKERDTEKFFINIIDDRLNILAKNYDLVKMLLSESLRGNLTNEINLPEIIFSSLKKGLEFHFKQKNQTVDIEFCARQLGGIFLSYVVLPNGEQFNKLTKVEKQIIAKKHAKALLVSI